uniref:F-box domain-containing protein n=1 Tax=Strongyloides venezuelensis TaxID=75913 RepID=A0A0K0F2X7_STRVS
MDLKTNYSFVELMEINLIRKKIIKMLSCWSDFENLSKTCRWIHYLVNKENISRKIILYNDMPHIKIDGVRDSYESTVRNQNINEITIKTDDRYFKTIDDGKKYNHEIIINGNCINLSIENGVGKLTKSDHETFIKQLTNEIEGICHLRKHSTTLRFMEYYFANDYMLLHLLSHLKSHTITSIHIPLHSMMFGAQRYKGLNEDIFEGISKLNELVLFTSPAINEFTPYVNNRTIVDSILKSFSKKKNPVLVFKDLGCGYQLISSYIHMILGIAVKYEIKIKWNITSTFQFFNRKNNDRCSIGSCSHFPLEKFISTFSCSAREPETFIHTMNNMRRLVNLETLNLRIFFSNLKEKMERMGIDIKDFSLRHCKSIKNLVLDFKEHLTINYKTDIKTIHDDLKYLASLMPTTIQKLEINNCQQLTKNVTEVITKYIPNIQLIIFNNVTYNDPDSLDSFKNLQVYISSNNFPPQLPNTVKFLAVGNGSKLFFSNNDSPSNAEEQLRKYSKMFSKNLYTNRDDNIFFDDLTTWEEYRNLLMDNFIM